MSKRKERFFTNLIIPAFVFGGITGIFTAIIILLYKLVASFIINLSETGYDFFREKLIFIPLVLIGLFALSLLFSFIYKKNPRFRGGGIPSSIASLRGIITFKWLRNLIGVFFMSLASFLVGVPLGNEGPSVQMGTSIGKGSVKLFAKKHSVYSRYSMTGGACAGFAVATGSPVSGILFAIEEAHHRVSPTIIIVACVSVLFARITTELLAPVLGVSISLFPSLQLYVLTVKDVWIPIIVGILMGLFGVAFLKFYKLISKFFNTTLKKVNPRYKIFGVFALTFAFGLVSFSFISTGHELIFTIIHKNFAIYALILLLIVRITLTLCASSAKITGGIFLPILAIGAIFSALVFELLSLTFNLEQSYYTIILALGITACIAGIMKMPLTAIIFSVEALSCYSNILYAIIVSVIAYVITVIFKTKSINDSVIDNIIKERNERYTPVVIDAFVTIQKDSFAHGKQIRDILWPANLFVLSFKPSESRIAKVDEHGEKTLHEGDILHVRYSTLDDTQTKKELTAIVGEQNYDEKEITNI